MLGAYEVDFRILHGGEVRWVIDASLSEGFKDREIEVLRGKGDELMGEIAEHGFGQEDAREFVDAAGEGKTLVAARVPEEFWRWSCRDIIGTPAPPCRSRRPDSNGDRAFPESHYDRQHA
jgi:hypothetical protein